MRTYTRRGAYTHLVVSSASVADDVHHHIALEYLSILSSKTAHSNHLRGCWCGHGVSRHGLQLGAFGIDVAFGRQTDLINVIAIDVENRRTDRLRNTSLTCMHTSKINPRWICAAIVCTHRVDGGSGHPHISCEPDLKEMQRIG